MNNRERFYIVSLLSSIGIAIFILLIIWYMLDRAMTVPQELWFALGVCGAFITGLHIPFNPTDKGGE